MLFNCPRGIRPPVFDFSKMIAQPLEDGITLSFGDFPLYFREREMDDIVVGRNYTSSTGQKGRVARPSATN
jgi:hypothetical protein